jgi:hypothetical protein
VSVTYYEQKAEMLGIKAASRRRDAARCGAMRRDAARCGAMRRDAAMPEYGEVHAQALKDVVSPVDRAFQAFFRRVKGGRQATRVSTGVSATTASPIHGWPNVAAPRDNRYLVLSKLGRIAVRWSRPLERPTKTAAISQEATGW